MPKYFFKFYESSSFLLLSFLKNAFAKILNKV